LESSIKKIEFLLILICLVLCAIWTLKSSIALRNILIVIGSMLSLTILYSKSLKDGDYLNKQYLTLNNLPLILLLITTVWVVIVIILFSKYPDLSQKELMSFWIRAILAILIGSVLGTVIRSKEKLFYFFNGFIWLIIIILYQKYIINTLNHNSVPNGINPNSLFLPSFYPEYRNLPYEGKTNFMMPALIYISGTLVIFVNSKNNFILRALTFTAWLLILYAFINIFDSRFSLIFCLIIILIFFVSILIKYKKKNNNNINKIIIIIMTVFLSSSIFYQSKINKGWSNFFSEVKAGLIMGNYELWKKNKDFNFPKSNTGYIAQSSNYERAALLNFGIGVLASHPMGNGVLERSLEITLRQYDSDNEFRKDYGFVSTHSGLLDFGLAYGVVGLSLLIVTIMSLIYVSLRENKRETNLNSKSLVSIFLLVAYTFSELGAKHNIEFLYFWVAFLTMFREQRH